MVTRFGDDGRTGGDYRLALLVKTKYVPEIFIFHGKDPISPKSKSLQKISLIYSLNYEYIKLTTQIKIFDKLLFQFSSRLIWSRPSGHFGDCGQTSVTQKNSGVYLKRLVAYLERAGVYYIKRAGAASAGRTKQS